jgi:AcrR family transcriptional regulator
MPPRGLYAKGIAKRDEILVVALDLVARQGFRQTSVKDIADAVGLTQAGLLHYFETKDELWVEVLRRRDAADIATDWQGGDLVSKLAELVQHNTQVPGLVQMFVNLSAAAATQADHPARTYFRERYHTLRQSLIEDIGRLQREGSVRSDIDASQLASVLLAVSDGMQVQWLFDPDRDMSEHVALVAKLAATEPGDERPSLDGA